MRPELAGGGNDLLCGRPFTNYRVTGDLLAAGFHPPGFHRLDGEVDSSGRIVIGHAGGIGCYSRSGRKNVKHDNPGIRLLRLMQGKRNEPIQVAKVRCDKDYGWMSPSVESGFRHGTPLIRKERRTKVVSRMCLRSPNQVR